MSECPHELFETFAYIEPSDGVPRWYACTLSVGCMQCGALLHFAERPPVIIDEGGTELHITGSLSPTKVPMPNDPSSLRLSDVLGLAPGESLQASVRAESGLLVATPPVFDGEAAEGSRALHELRQRPPVLRPLYCEHCLEDSSVLRECVFTCERCKDEGHGAPPREACLTCEANDNYRNRQFDVSQARWLKEMKARG